jgi:hypothetical protein
MRCLRGSQDRIHIRHCLHPSLPPQPIYR